MKETLILGNYENEEFVRGKAMLILELSEMTYEELMEISNEK